MRVILVTFLFFIVLYVGFVLGVVLPKKCAGGILLPDGWLKVKIETVVPIPFLEYISVVRIHPCWLMNKVKIFNCEEFQ